MVDEYSCDLVPALVAEDGGLIPYLGKKKKVNKTFNRYKILKLGPV